MEIESDEGGSRAAVVERVPEPDRAAVQTVMVDELRRLHEGVLARYDLRPSAFGLRNSTRGKRGYRAVRFRSDSHFLIAASA